MSTKLQVIVPIFIDPLLCQLYFRNYVKYKHRYVDRLIILIQSNVLRRSFHKTDECKEIIDVSCVGECFEKNLVELKRLLRELNIENYIIKSDLTTGIHGNMFLAAIDEIKDENYHTLFDEQDAYWLNDNFGEICNQLNEYDLIGGGRSDFSIPYMGNRHYIEKLNEKFKLNHTRDFLCSLWLPEFLSNRILKKIDNFSGNSGVLNVRSFYDDSAEDETIGLETFQPLNVEVYTKTDKVKIYMDQDEWDVALPLADRKWKKEINFDKYILYHSLASRILACSMFFNHYDQEYYLQDLKSTYVRFTMLNRDGQFYTDFHYQSLRYLNFPTVEIYKKNFELLTQIEMKPFISPSHPLYYEVKDGQTFDLHYHDCKKLIEKIL